MQLEQALQFVTKVRELSTKAHQLVVTITTISLHPIPFLCPLAYLIASQQGWILAANSYSSSVG
jgi:hypothetical protein